jgi:riboflavin kinase
MKPTKLHLLGELCRSGATSAEVKATTTELAAALDASQQTVSRWLSELSADGLISRKGKRVRLTRRARAEIEALAKAFEAAPAPKEKTVLRGVVVRGLGEGARFMSLPRYSRQLRAALGWAPFAGTLNLKLDEAGARVKRELEARRGIEVKSFFERNQRFGSVKLFPCLVKSNSREERGAVILPEKSFYGESVLEVVSPRCLRRALRLKDGCGVQVKLLVFE